GRSSLSRSPVPRLRRAFAGRQNLKNDLTPATSRPRPTAPSAHCPSEKPVCSNKFPPEISPCRRRPSRIRPALFELPPCQKFSRRPLRRIFSRQKPLAQPSPHLARPADAALVRERLSAILRRPTAQKPSCPRC